MYVCASQQRDVECACIWYTVCIKYTHVPLQVPVVKQESDGDLTASINDISSQEEDGLLADNMSEGMDSETSQSGTCKLCYVK